jgi:hypothetical protein
MPGKKPTAPVLSVLIPLVISIFISTITVGPFYFFWGNSYKQVNREGVIKIVARYLPQQTTKQENTAFYVLIETHSDEFEFVDVLKLSFLRVNGGLLQQAIKWVPSGKGHHLNGVVTFDQKLSRGTHSLQLVIRNLDGSGDRVLNWQVYAWS